MAADTTPRSRGSAGRRHSKKGREKGTKRKKERKKKWNTSSIIRIDRQIIREIHVIIPSPIFPKSTQRNEQSINHQKGGHFPLSLYLSHHHLLFQTTYCTVICCGTVQFCQFLLFCFRFRWVLSILSSFLHVSSRGDTPSLPPRPPKRLGLGLGF